MTIKGKINILLKLTLGRIEKTNVDKSEPYK